MPTIELKGCAYDVTVTVEPTSDAPLDVYTAWASASGISPTANLWNIDNEQGTWASVGVPASLLGGVAVLSNTGQLGLYRTLTQPSEVTWWLYRDAYCNNRSLICAPQGSPPALTLAGESASEEGWGVYCTSGRSGTAGGVSLHYGVYTEPKWASPINTFPRAVRIAPGSIEIVSRANDGAALWVLRECDELPGLSGSAAKLLQESQLLAQAASSTYRLVIAVAPRLVGSLAGVAKFSDGAIASLVRVWRHDTGAWVGDAVPDPASGAWTLADTPATPLSVMIWRSGYRPLMHAPVSPVI